MSLADTMVALDAMADWAELRGLDYEAARCPHDGWGVSITAGTTHRWITPLRREKGETMPEYTKRQQRHTAAVMRADRAPTNKRGPVALHAAV